MLLPARASVLPSSRRPLTRYAVRCYATTGTYEQRDVVIVGGGPAGLVLASALSSSKIIRETLRVTLVEAGDLNKIKDWDMPSGIFHNRVSSVTNSSRRFLEDIGVWSRIDAARTQPVEDMEVWDGISDARIQFSASDLPIQKTKHLATMVENLNLQRASLMHLSQFPDTELLDSVMVQSITPDAREGGNWPVVHLSDGRIICTRLLIGADGFNSPVRKYAGINSYGWAYDTHGVVATMRHAPRGALQGPNSVAYQRFLATGPIAFLPLSETVSSLVWSTKPPLAAALKAVDAHVLAGMINAAFRLPAVSMKYLHERLLESHTSGSPLSAEQFREELAFREKSDGVDARSAYSSLVAFDAPEQAVVGIPPEDAHAVPPLVTAIQPGTVASFPLRFSHAEEYIGEGAGARTVLVGDAAHTIHPLAGQGLNGGLADVEALVGCIESAVRAGADIGSYTFLRPYARDRYLENHSMLSVCDKLHKLYSSEAPPIVWARTVGLEVLNELDTVKAALVLAAGSERRKRNPEVGWEVAAQGMQELAKGVDNARAIGGALVGMVSGGLKYVLQQVATGTRSPRP